MRRIKIATDMRKDEIKLVDKACNIEGRCRANFIRLACLEKAEKIIGDKKCMKK